MILQWNDFERKRSSDDLVILTLALRFISSLSIEIHAMLKLKRFDSSGTYKLETDISAYNRLGEVMEDNVDMKSCYTLLFTSDIFFASMSWPKSCVDSNSKEIQQIFL